MKKFSISILLAMLFIASCKEDKSSTLDPNQETALHYLINNSLITDTFSRVLYQHEIDFLVSDIKNDMLYFIFDKTLDKQKAIMQFARDTGLVEFAPCESGPCNFGGMEGNLDDIYAVRIPTDNLKVDTLKKIPFLTKKLQDSMTIPEIGYALKDDLYYGGKEYFVLGQYHFKNIGATIMKKQPSSKIYDVAQKIKGSETKKEKIIQKVLDVVANEIDYSYADLWYRTEILQHAHDVLLAGIADCSGKTVLMASLLEQLDIPYVLLYYDKHVNIGVQGDFPNNNGYEVPIENENFTVAETTCPNFVMGETLLEENVIPKLAYYQMPKKDGQIYDYLTEKKMKLYSEEEIEEIRGY